MAKYIVNLPDEILEFMNDKFNFFIEPEVKVGECRHYKVRLDDTEITPYTEPDRKAIDLQHAHDIENVARMNYSKGAEDAWEFVNTLYGLSDEELYEIFDDGNYCEHSYQEAKAKYEEWKKQKAEIRVGDEVEYYCGKNIRFVVCGIYKGIAYGFKYCTGFGCLDMGDYCKIDELKKTGRHYDSVEKLLEEMREETE